MASLLWIFAFSGNGLVVGSWWLRFFTSRDLVDALYCMVFSIIPNVAQGNNAMNVACVILYVQFQRQDTVPEYWL